MDFFQDGHTLAYIWIGSGILLIVGEFFIPGTFVAFLGISAVLVGFFAYFFEFGLWTQVAIWAVSSGLLILIGGTFLRKFFPSASEKAILNPEEATGRIVPVTKDILVQRKGGRVSFQGTEWDAISKSRKVSAGKKVRILERENLTFIVEPLDFPEEL